MSQENTFDANAYFTRLTEESRLALRGGFAAVKSSGIDSIEGIIEGRKSSDAFVCIDDTSDTNYHARGGGVFALRVWTIHIVRRHRRGDMADREVQLEECRRLFRSFYSRMLRDRLRLEGLYYVDLQQVLTREYPQTFIDGLTGLYMTLSADEPVDMTYDTEEWEDG